MSLNLYEQLGGEAKLRQIIDSFIDRVFEDRMIGFFFRNADKKRIKEMEFQLILYLPLNFVLLLRLILS